MLLLIALVVGGLMSMCGHSTHTPAAEPLTPAAEPPPIARPLPVTCPTKPPSGALVDGLEQVSITLPDLAGTNGQAAENCLKNLGVSSVELSSGNPKYSMVIVASNWTVVSTDPAPGSVVSDLYSRVVLRVTKP
jgi:beta-lactam-binding protein with PASTA domain